LRMQRQDIRQRLLPRATTNRQEERRKMLICIRGGSFHGEPRASLRGQGGADSSVTSPATS
jgi:hypothetical protein